MNSSCTRDELSDDHSYDTLFGQVVLRYTRLEIELIHSTGNPQVPTPEGLCFRDVSYFHLDFGLGAIQVLVRCLAPRSLSTYVASFNSTYQLPPYYFSFAPISYFARPLSHTPSPYTKLTQFTISPANRQSRLEQPMFHTVLLPLSHLSRSVSTLLVLITRPFYIRTNDGYASVSDRRILWTTREKWDFSEPICTYFCVRPLFGESEHLPKPVRVRIHLHA